MGVYTTIQKQNRRKSYEEILKDLGERHQQCLKGIIELGGKATANSLARFLLGKGIIPFYNTNYTNPRLIELAERGLIKVTSRTKDEFTGRNVSVYELI
jgi:arginine decarboxylase-like protein